MTAVPALVGSVRVTLPMRTVNESNGSHGHWAAKARRRKDQRTTTAIVVGMHLRGSGVGLPVTVTMTRLAPSSGLDDDNLRGALKSVRDGVADALGLNDDRDERVTWEYRQLRTSRKSMTLVRGYGVEVRIKRYER